MPLTEPPHDITAHSTITAFSPEAWDLCAGAENPFVSHGFLRALEQSGSVGENTGWSPCHLAVKDQTGQLLACAPLYLKSHSYGEYVFDWGWAQAYERAGGRYYPKLQCAVPFTPVTGPRLLVHPQAPDPQALRTALAQAMISLAGRLEASSVHITFAAEEECKALAPAGFLHRIGQQYHWQNRGYGCFDDFLAELSSRKRKAIRKEREKAQSQGIVFRALSGAAITPAHWNAFYQFYLSTIDRKWAAPYLTRRFFPLLGESLGDQVVLIVGEREDDGTPVCAALNLRGGESLYGRTWGAAGDYRFLHFECCYYQAMDYAIAHGLTWVEAGAQGEHKISRGYLPRLTWSAHWLADPRLSQAVAHFLDHERGLICEDAADLAACGPFRREE